MVDVDYDGEERRGLVAVCRRDGKSHRVSLDDIVAGAVTPRTAALLAGYRRWSDSGARGGLRLRERCLELTGLSLGDEAG